MRVAILSLNAPAGNAIGNAVAAQVEFFLDRGAETLVLLEDAARVHPGVADHFRVVRPNAPLHPATRDFLLSADLVIAQITQGYDLLNLLPLLAGGKPRVIVDYQGVTPPRFASGPQRAVLERGLEQRGLVWCADAVVVHSDFMRREILTATGFPADRVHELEYPIPERFHPGQPSAAGTYPVGLERDRVALFVGRLAANKRAPVLIEVIARMRKETLAVHAVLIGDHGDAYSEEWKRCRDLADRWRVADRVHWLGPVDDEALADWYRRADVLVLPSVHEGFCIPVLEAMASGLSVLAARSTALPGTVADAGLTFTPDDPDDLARQMRRVLREERGHDKSETRRVAIVSFRYGKRVVGGAERSLRTIAAALLQRGMAVEVFTTCVEHESDWRNDLPAGDSIDEGVVVRRFPIDAQDRGRHQESVRRILEAEGDVDAAAEEAYLMHSLHSTPLIEALRRRSAEFDAILAGPYLSGLTWDVARECPEKTLVVPCFHEEPLARLRVWPRVYGSVAGLLYHSPEEQQLAQARLGVNHPNATVIGTYLPAFEPEALAREEGVWRDDPSSLALRAQTYLVYCGRYSEQKGLPRLLGYFDRYQRIRPGRFALALMGAGPMPLPSHPWLRNLGHLEEPEKALVLARSAALLQMSRQESLSLVALEAWAVRTPVIVDRACAVLEAQVTRSGGGVAVADFDDFARALDDLWDRPDDWRERGNRGRDYVKSRYGDQEAFAEKIIEAIRGVRMPLQEQMRRRGLERASRCRPEAWRVRFGQMIEQVLDTPGRVVRGGPRVVPFRPGVSGAAGQEMLVPVRLVHEGSHAVTHEGPARTVVCAEVVDHAGVAVGPVLTTPLSGVLIPGKSQSLAVRVQAPPRPGDYQVRLYARREDVPDPEGDVCEIDLSVGMATVRGAAAPLLDAVQEVLIEADRVKRLPDDYVDVTLGWCARWKRWLKAKLLGNFKHAYVDVLSRQQSRVNEKLLLAVQELSEACAVLDHAVRGLQERLAERDVAKDRESSENVDRINPTSPLPPRHG